MIYIDRTTCAGCAVCVDICPTGAISLDEKEDVATIDQSLCTECLACLDACPTGAVRRAELSERVPAGEGEIVEGEVIESQMIPAPVSRPLVATRQPGRLAALASAALAFVGKWLLPRAADALVRRIEHRLAQGTNSATAATSPSSEDSSLSKQMGNARGGRGRQRRRRRRGQ